MIGQIAPRDTGPRNPENAVQNKTMVLRAVSPTGHAAHNERLKARLFLNAHQSTDHGRFSKNYIESETCRFGNPVYPHDLAPPIAAFQQTSELYDRGRGVDMLGEQNPYGTQR